MRLRKSPSNAHEGRGWGPFTSRQLTTIVCVAIIAAVMIPTAAMAAIGTFTSTTATPAVTGTNSATVANAKGVVGSATGTNTNARYGVAGNASGANGVGVQGTGTKYGVFSNGPLGVAAGKPLTCAGCVTVADLSNAVGRTRAYAYVHDDGTIDPVRSRNIAVTHVGGNGGSYCVKVSNVPLTTIAPVVTISDQPLTAIPYIATISFDANALANNCPPGNNFVVITWRQENSGFFAGFNVDFTIVIP